MLWIVLCTLSYSLQNQYIPACKDLYSITEIKTNYCIASNNKTSIVLYNVENPNYQDTYSISSFEPIHSLHNLYQFSFEEYLHTRNIYEMASSFELVSKSNSIQSKLYSFFSNVEHADYYKLYLYGIHNEEVPNILSRLSLPFITSMIWLEKLLKKKLDDRLSSLIIVFISCVFGYLFVFKVSLIRFIVFKFGKILFKQWENSFSFSLFVFLIFQPCAYKDFALVFPLCMHLISHFIVSKRYRTICSSLFLVFLQLIYFHEMDIFFTICFTLIRNWNSILFLCSLFLPFLFQLLIDIPISFPSFSIHFVPNFVFIVLFGLMILYLLKHNRKWFFICILLCIYPFTYSYLDPFFHVYMLDIGQGDCTVIVEPFHKSVVMIDCGQNLYRDNVTQIIVPFLDDLHIHHLDYLIVTHDDFDHSGGKDELESLIPIDKVITDSHTPIYLDYPFYSLLPERSQEDENDRSIISYFSYDSSKYLWMGDASISVEKQLMKQYKLDVDILKLGHHGSNTSSSYSFLESLHPKMGLISVGYKNKYGHPSRLVVSNCKNLGIHVLETKDVGMIHIFSWKWFSFVECANGIISVINSI